MAAPEQPPSEAVQVERTRAAWQAVLRLRVLSRLREDPSLEESAALVAAVCQGLAPGDALVTAHRAVAYAVARGVPGATRAEGPMVSAPYRFFGGEGPGLALSLALAAAMHAHPRVTVFACDATQPATEELTQALELAAMWSLPVAFVAGWSGDGPGPAPWVTREVDGLRQITLDCDDAVALCGSLNRALAGVRRGESPCVVGVRCRPSPQAALESLEVVLRQHGLSPDERPRLEARLRAELEEAPQDEEARDLPPPRGPVQ